MNRRQHTTADRARAHREGQRKIVHYCDCGMAPRGNAAWWSHVTANPGHRQLSRTDYQAKWSNE